MYSDKRSIRNEREERSYQRENRYRESRRSNRSKSRYRTREECRIVQSGMLMEEGIFLNKGLRNCSDSQGQIMIVDSGCPRSLMGNKELAKLKEIVDVKEFKVKDEGFRFGPSRVYNTDRKVKFKMEMGINEIEWEFFVVEMM